MIDFNCPGCAKRITVADTYAGRKARCNACGGDLTVPARAEAPQANAPRQPMRVRRLLADAEEIQRVFADSELIRVRPQGQPPIEVYEIDYTITGLERGERRDQPRPRTLHTARVQLTADYPRLAPRCTMLTPVFHPNIDPTTICIGDHWTAGERLVDLIVRIGEMIAYQAYNIRSPLDAEAAMWADLNSQTLPVDPRSLRPGE